MDDMYQGDDDMDKSDKAAGAETLAGAQRRAAMYCEETHRWKQVVASAEAERDALRRQLSVAQELLQDVVTDDRVMMTGVMYRREGTNDLCFCTRDGVEAVKAFHAQTVIVITPKVMA